MLPSMLSGPYDPFSSSIMAQEPFIELWPQGKIPGTTSITGPETLHERGDHSPKRADRARLNISVPGLTIVQPDNPNGTAVIICPGGAYWRQVFDKEGIEIADALREWGYTAFILKYRLPTEWSSEAPLIDALRALRLVRARADDFGVQADRIGIMGFSAGGHLSGLAAVHFNHPSFLPEDELPVSSRPDFACLCYAVSTMTQSFGHHLSIKNLLCDSPALSAQKLYSIEFHVTDQTPPTFLAQGSDDTTVVPENSIMFYRALLEHGVPAEMHIYANVAHGFGARPETHAGRTWLNAFQEWLKVTGIC